MPKPLLGLLSPAGERARLSVLILHRVLPEPDPIYLNRGVTLPPSPGGPAQRILPQATLPE